MVVTSGNDGGGGCIDDGVDDDSGHKCGANI